MRGSVRRTAPGLGQNAFGYPACPDHTPKGTLFTLLDNESHHTVKLTESYAMHPTASVSGL